MERGVRLVFACALAIVLLGRHAPENFRLQTPPPVPSAAPRPVPADEHGYYFGGRYVTGLGTSFDLGQAADSRWAFFTRLLPRAFAAPGVVAPSCLAQPVPAPAAAAAASGPVADDLPGFYGAPWVGGLNGNLIAALHVRVPRNAASPVPEPDLEIYPNYDGTERSPAFVQAARVAVARGRWALLYRMYPSGPITCIDLLVPNGSGVGTAYIYYPFHRHLLEVEGAFRLQR